MAKAKKDKIITLDSGEVVRETPEGRRYLIPGPDPTIVAAEEAWEAEKELAQQQRQDLLDAIAAKQQSLHDNPSVPPEKRVI